MLQTKTFNDIFPSYLTFKTSIVDVISSEYIPPPLWLTIDWPTFYLDFGREYSGIIARYDDVDVINYIILTLKKFLPQFYKNQQLLTMSGFANVYDPTKWGIILQVANSNDSSENPLYEWNNMATTKSKQGQTDVIKNFFDSLNLNINNNIIEILKEFNFIFTQIFEGGKTFNWWF